MDTAAFTDAALHGLELFQPAGVGYGVLDHPWGLLAFVPVVIGVAVWLIHTLERIG